MIGHDRAHGMVVIRRRAEPGAQPDKCTADLSSQT
jgi:hypothetical protein